MMVDINRFIANAHWHSVILNSSMQIDPKIGIVNLNNHINDCIQIPTIGLLARHSELSKHKKTKNYVLNKELADKNRETIILNLKLDKKIAKLYPKTKYTREVLINNNRLDLTQITPKITSNRSRKILKLHIIFHNIKSLIKK